MNSNLKTGDTVVVITGKDKGKKGKIVASDAQKSRVVVANVNIVSKHRKPRSQTDKGGIKKVEAPIDVSNVQIICPVCGKATRIGHMIDEKGNKHRMCKKCKALMDGEKRIKVAKTVDKEVVEKTADKTTETTAEKVVEKNKVRAKTATKVAIKAPTKLQNARVATKAKVDTAKVKRITPQAKSTSK